MRGLIDTHVVLWYLAGDERLPPKYRTLLAAGSQELFFSAASAAEISAKFVRGKLTLPEPPVSLIPKVMDELRLLPLPITLEHGLRVSELPLHHADPFDRLLIAQARCERLPLITGDSIMRRYDVEVVW